MRASQYLLATVKETPSDAETASHQLMIRAGLIRKLATGLYTWLPLGLRVLRKVTEVVREEMDKAGAMEVSMPIVQPAELWLETGRWQTMGPELLRFKDRHDRDFCLGPTHEEVITDLVRNEINSYRQLPANLYQIQTKFRDERRPRFGVMRAREFTMKDAYSFHMNQESLDQTYQIMHATYSAIFSRLGLDFRPVAADSGNIGGNTSHEFHVLADSGEDEIVFSSDGNYAANMEMATGTLPPLPQETSRRAKHEVATGDAHSIEDLCTHLSINATACVKTLVVHGCDAEGEKSGELIALYLRGDQTLNETKTAKLARVFSPLEFADDEVIEATLGCKPGAIGPNSKCAFSYADPSALGLVNFVCGANKEDTHFIDANWDDETRYDEVADIRCVQEGDISPDGKGTLAVKRGIEVGHIFQLGDKYSAALKATALDENGKSVVMSMGCYGIGVTRVVAACIEQNHDEHGIIWPENIAPYSLVIVQVDAHKSELVRTVSEEIYQLAQGLGIEVLLDDRDKKTSPGVKFADSELIGIPHRLVISPRSLADGVVEYKRRGEADKQLLASETLAGFVSSLAAGENS
ncbi:proline--tRNA ligase [Gammaproteobacteria bacterium]|jgi:prolyl-tRNA synthetase|nr:proline--tRNA ligase [Gammaproteobacteria bacterium]MDA9188260.1 proline--tRNA ligase [bacterium]MCH9855805.1 proline--tRNA ligase [Gammaproteobacteria bacterium]MDA8671919.1 proline--tRNA ligase [Gammaproteobacteria bacterium]MDA9130226.1 proline--tRNA ligase [Gammaproteobacteria bacterium]